MPSQAVAISRDASERYGSQEWAKEWELKRGVMFEIVQSKQKWSVQQKLYQLLDVCFPSKYFLYLDLPSGVFHG